MIKIYTRENIQTVYKQHHYHTGTVLYSENGYHWKSVPMDSGKWNLNWKFAFIKKEENKMSTNYINRQHDEEIIDIVRSVLDNGTGKAETANEHILIKLMQIRNTPIKNFTFDQERVDRIYKKWTEE